MGCLGGVNASVNSSHEIIHSALKGNFSFEVPVGVVEENYKEFSVLLVLVTLKGHGLICYSSMCTCNL